MARKSIIDLALKDDVRQSYKKNEMQRQWEECMPEKKKEWQEELELELDREERCASHLEDAKRYIVLDLMTKRTSLKTFRPKDLACSLVHYSNRIDSLFHSMHRIVYIESLLYQEMPEED